SVSLGPIVTGMTASGDHKMEREQVFDAMGKLKLYGMRTAYDEIITTAVIGSSVSSFRIVTFIMRSTLNTGPNFRDHLWHQAKPT
ncbi:MAG: hypothetical protein AB8C02_06170, partial [Halioglobus sp.]